MSLPYCVGDTLTLQNLDKTNSANDIEVVIDEVFERTLSCTMRVRYGKREEKDKSPKLDEIAKVGILKMYDWRYSDRQRMRNDQWPNPGDYPWNTRIEKEYIKSIRNGSLADFIHDLQTGNLEQYGDAGGWTIAQYEAWTHKVCNAYFDSEVEVYKALKAEQGVKIPKFYHRVRLLKPSPTPSGTRLSKEQEKSFRVNGIIIECLSAAFPLAYLDEKLPAKRHQWQAIFDQAMTLPQMLTDNRILNRDISKGNILVTEDKSMKSGYRAVMIDFGCCRFRGKRETDLDWGRANHAEALKRDFAQDMQEILRFYANFDLVVKETLVQKWSRFARPESEDSQETKQKRRETKLPKRLSGVRPKRRSKCEIM